jgi:Zn finger protein HypA/HybF involved in hydrogenase expression
MFATLADVQDQPSTAEPTEAKKAVLECSECGSPYGRHWHTSDGVATLCPTCAQFFGLGCP